MPARKAIENQSERGKRRYRSGLKNASGLVITKPVDPPDWLDTDAGRRCFLDNQKPLIEAGLLQSLDLPNLALMAQFWSDYIEARDMVREAHETVSRYVAVNGSDDLIKMMNESLKHYQLLLAKFAGSPIDRTRIVIREPKKQSTIDDIFGGAK